MTSQVGQSVQKRPRIRSESCLHFRLNIMPVSLFLNSTSWFDRWIAIAFWSNEYRIDKTGPSPIKSEFGGLCSVGAPTFQDNTWKSGYPAFLSLSSKKFQDGISCPPLQNPTNIVQATKHWKIHTSPYKELEVSSIIPNISLHFIFSIQYDVTRWAAWQFSGVIRRGTGECQCFPVLLNYMLHCLFVQV